MPASSANLGAGYDCLGVALAMTNRVSVEARVGAEQPIELTVVGEGHDELTPDRDNRFVRGLEAAIGAAWGEVPADIGWRIEMHNDIPLSRGLGSSAAATVGGVLAGQALAGGALDQGALLRLATEIEGHPDNAAAVLIGGFVASSAGPDGVEAVRFDAPEGLGAVLFVPDLRLSTAAMRAVLPAAVPFADAVANLGAVAVGVSGLASGRFDLLRHLTVDRLHEPYRATAFRELPDLVAAARDAGAIGACLSGAGSTVIAFVDAEPAAASVSDAFEATAARLQLPGHARTIGLRNEGARIVARA
jgi:homoserine kinase